MVSSSQVQDFFMVRSTSHLIFIWDISCVLIVIPVPPIQSGNRLTPFFISLGYSFHLGVQPFRHLNFIDTPLTPPLPPLFFIPDLDVIPIVVGGNVWLNLLPFLIINLIHRWEMTLLSIDDPVTQKCPEKLVFSWERPLACLSLDWRSESELSEELSSLIDILLYAPTLLSQ